jgi:hypothetical protein
MLDEAKVRKVYETHTMVNTALAGAGVRIFHIENVYVICEDSSGSYARVITREQRLGRW